MGPVVSAEHKKFVIDWINKAVQEGAKLILDGRNKVVPGYEKGFFIGPTIFDHVTEKMTCGQQEVFGPVTFIKRVKDFEEGITLMNRNQFANGSAIFTESGHYAREFTFRTDGGMVGVNVGIPVPVSYFPFCGHKNSFFGDLHCMGKGRRAVLHRVKGNYLPVVDRFSQAAEGEHLGRDHGPRITCWFRPSRKRGMKEMQDEVKEPFPYWEMALWS